MKDELQTKLLEILTAIQTNTGKAIATGTELAGKAGDFALEQLPDIAQSYVAFARAWETFGAVLWWGFCVASVYLLIKACKSTTWVDCHGEWADGRITLAVASSIGFLMSLIGAVKFTKAALFVWFAPKVWLIQELAKLIGTMKG